MTLKELLNGRKIDPDISLLILNETIILCLRIDTGEIQIDFKTYSKFISIIEKETGLTWQKVKSILTFKGGKS